MERTADSSAAFFRCVELRWQRCGDREIKQWMMQRGLWARIGEEGFERAAGRTADPSAALGMTRGEERPRLEWLVDGGNCRFFRCVELRWQTLW